MSRQPAHDPFGRPTLATHEPSGSHLEAETTLASRWARLGAWVTDGVIALAPLWFLIDLVLRDGGEADIDALGLLLISAGLSIVSAIVFLVYSALLLSRSGTRNGQTLGKQIVGIRVVAGDGARSRPEPRSVASSAVGCSRSSRCSGSRTRSRSSASAAERSTTSSDGPW